MAGWEAVAAIGDIAASLTQGILNPILQKKTADENRAFQAQENQITRAREDNAHVREVADLEAAGLSPLASVNGAQASQGIASNQEAPQMDLSAMNDAIKTIIERETAKEALDEQKREHDQNLTHQQKILAENRRQFDENLKQTKEIHDDNLKQQMEIVLIQEKRLNEQIERTAEQESRANKIKVSEISFQEYKFVCEKWSYNFKQQICVDYETYLIEKNRYDGQLNSFITFLRGKGVKEPNLSESGSGSLSVGAGANSGSGATETISQYYRGNNQYYTRNTQQHGSHTSSGSNFGAAASGSGSWSRSGEWVKQATMSDYIKEYCDKAKIKMNEFLIFPIYKPRGKELEKAK